MAGIMDAKSVSWEFSVPELKENIEAAELLPVHGNGITMNGDRVTYASFINDTTALICPENITSYTDLNSCVAVISAGLEIEDPNQIISSLTWEMTGATEASSNSSGVNQLNSYSFNEGTTVITYRGATHYNNSIYCTFTVTVSDNQVPRLENPQEDITVRADAGDCYAFVDWPDPVVSDNCASPSQILITGSHEPGTSFPVGTTEVSYSINDGIEYNNLEYSFTVTVVDEEVPEIFAPHDITLNCGDAIPDAFTNWQQFYDAGGMAFDNCNIDQSSFKYQGQQSSGIRCPYTITRTYSIADADGNLAEVEHLIYVGEEAEEEQQEAPVVLKSGMAECTASSGNWSDASIWSCGHVPTSVDNVSISDTVTVTIDVAAECDDITLAGTLNHSGATSLNVNGDWINDGTYSGGSGIVEFTGSTSATISGDSATTFNEFILNKGSDVTTDLNVQSDITITDLTFNNGVLDIESSTTHITDIVNANNTIPSTSGLRVSGGILTTGYYSIINEGLIEVTSGGATFGTGIGNRVHTQIDGAFIVSGGTVNITGRLENTAGGTLAGYPSGINISGGIITLATAGNNESGTGSLDVTTNGAFNFTGGTIVFQNPSTAGSALDLGVIDGTGNGAKTTIGGTFQFGNGSTPASSTFTISSEIPLDRITSSTNADLVLGGDLTVNDLSLNSATSINLNGNSLRQTISGIGTYSFPLDDGSGNDVSVDITIISVSSSGVDPFIEIMTTDVKYSDNASSTNFLSRYWTITFNDLTVNYSLSANYSSADIAGTESEIAAGVWSGSTPWIKGDAASGNTISATGLSGDGTIILSGITLDAPTVEINGGVANEEICDGASVLLTAVPTGDPGWIYSWSSTPVGFSASSSSVSVSPTSTTTYTVVVTDGNGFTASDYVDVVVDPTSVGGTASADQTICENSSPSDLTLTGYTGTIQWQWSPDGTSSWTDIGSATGATLTTAQMGSLSADRYYRAEVTSGSCPPAYSSTVVISVDPTSVGGTASVDQTICENSSPSDLTLTGYTGTIQWQWSPDGTSSWTDIGSATGSTLTTAQMGSLSADRYYRAEVISGVCNADYSSTVQITVTPTVTINAFSPATSTRCQGVGTVTYTTAANNSTGITYSLDALSISEGNTINATTGEVTYVAGWSGTTTITASAAGCNGPATADHVVTTRPTPTATISGDTEVCRNESPAPEVTFHNPMDLPVTITYTRNLILQPTVDVDPNTSVSIAVPVSSANTYRYILAQVSYQDVPSCTETISDTATVVVNPIPTAGVDIPSQGVCTGEVFSTIHISGSPIGTTYSWDRDHPEVTGMATSGTLDSISGSLINDTEIPITVTFTITPEYNGCTGTSVTARVTVYPIPQIIFTNGEQERCSGEAMSEIVPSSNSGGTFTWERDHLDDIIGVDTSGTGIVPSSTITNTTNEPITVNFIFTPTANECEGLSDTATVVVYPTPYIIDTSETICNAGDFDITPVDGPYGVVPIGTTYEWTVNSASGGLSGAVDGSGPSISGSLTNSTNSTQYVTYGVYPYYGDCPRGELFLLTIYVTPEPNIDDLTPEVCSGEPLAVTPLNNTNGIVPAGTTYEWEVVAPPAEITGWNDGSGPAITDTLFNTSSTSKVVSYKVVPSAGTCVGDTFTVDVTVKPAPAIDNLDTLACSEETFSVTPQNGADGIVPAGTTYSWPIPNMSDGMTGGSPGSGALSISGTLTNPSDTAQTATYTVTPSVGGCAGEPFDVVVTVYPKPAINPMRDTICSGGDFDLTPTDGINGSIPPGTSYSWLAPSVTGITGTTAGNNEASISDTLFNSTTTVKTVTYTVTPTSGDCDGNNFSVIILVNPQFSVNDMSATVCSDEAFSVAPLNGVNGTVPAGTTYSWSTPTTIHGSAGGGGGSGTSITDTLYNSSSYVDTVTYIVSPIAGSCSGNDFELKVIVNPIPDVTIGGDDTVCYGVETPDITFTNHVNLPVTATYKINGGADFTVDIDANGTTPVPATINQEGALVYSLESVVYQFAPTCIVTLADTATILVEPITTVVISKTPAGAICFGDSVTFFSSVENEGSGATYQWYINDLAQSGENDTIFGTTILDDTNEVKLVVTTINTPCNGDITSNVITMTVNPLNIPEVTIYESLNDICEGTSVTFTADPVINGGTNPTFEWFLNDDPVGGNDLTYVTDSLSDGDEVKVVLTPDVTASCPGPPDTSNVVIMTVNPLDTVSVTVSVAADTVCVGTPVTFTATAVNGGSSPTYQWRKNGVNVGANNATYSFTPVNNEQVSVILTSDATCTTGNPAYSDTVTMVVNPLPTADAGGDTTICINEAVAVSGASATNYDTLYWVHDGNGSLADSTTLTPTYTSTTADEGNTVTLTLNSINSCGTALATYTINVDPMPTASAGGSTTICSNASATVSGASASNGDILWTKIGGAGEVINETSLTPTYIADLADEGDTVTLIMSVTSDNTCGTASDTAYYTIIVDSLPTASAGGDTTICLGETYTLAPGEASYSGGTILWTENGAGNITAGETTLTPTYEPAASDEGNDVILTMTVTSDNTCGIAKATANYTISVEAPLNASVSISADATEVCDNTEITFSATPVNGGASPDYEWYVNGNPLGLNDSIYTTDTLSDGALVYVELIPNEACVAGTPFSDTIPVTIVPDVPDAPDSISGLNGICPALTTVFTIPYNGADSYTWFVPDGWVIESGQGTLSLTVTVLTTADAGYVKVVANNVCGPSDTTYHYVNVDTEATVYAGPDQVVCQGTTSVNLSGQVGGAVTDNKQDWTWIAVAGNNKNNFKPDDLNTIYDFPDGYTTGTLYVVLQSDVLSVGCGYVADTMMITVLPNPTVDAGGPDTVCQSSTPLAITLSDASVGGGADSAAWSITSGGVLSSTAYTATPDAITFTPDAGFTGTVTLTLTTNALGGCTPASDTRTIVVLPEATVNAGLNDTICADGSASLAGSIGGAATSATWSTSGDGTFADSTLLNTVYTPGSSDSTGGTVTLTLTTNDPAGDCGPVSDDVVITINPVATVEAGVSDTVCQSDSPAAILLSGVSIGGSALTAAWSTSALGALSNTAQTATPGNVTYTPQPGSYGTDTLILTTNATGECPAATDIRLIVIEPAPIVIAGGPDTICEEEIPSAFELAGATIGGGATTGTWTITSGGGSLGFTSATEQPDTVTYTPAGSYSGTVTLTLTTDAPGTCVAVSATRTILIEPAPTVDAGSPDTICEDGSVILAGSVTGTAGTWSGGGGTFDPDYSTLDAVYTPSAAEIAAGYVTLTLTSNDPPGLCGAVSDTVRITIEPLVFVDAGLNDTICQGDVVALSGFIDGGVNTGAWIGGNGTFSGGRTNLSANYTPTTAEVNAGIVTLILRSDDPAGPCGPASDTTEITIYKAVVINSNPESKGVCVGDSTALTVVASGSQLSYQWYKNGVSIPGADTSILQYSSVNTNDDASYYVVVSGATECSSDTSNTVNINVDVAIAISDQPDSLFRCEGTNATFSVTADAGGLPLNYQWRHNGVDIGGANSSAYMVTNISVADSGRYDVVISSTAGFACDSTISDIATLTVNGPGTMQLLGNDSLTICMDSSISAIQYIIGGSATGYTLTGFLPAGVIPSMNADTLTIAGTPTETGTFDFTITTSGSPCADTSLTGQIIVEDAATIVLAGGNDTVDLCINNPLPAITYSIGGNATDASVDSLPSGITGTYNAGSGLFTISGTPTEAGTFPYTVSTEGSPCGNPALSGVITVTPDATIQMTAGSDTQTLCLDSTAISPLIYTIGGSATSAVISLGSLPDGVELTQTNDTVYTISGTPTEAGTFNFIVSTTGKCFNVSDTAEIIIEPMPHGGSISPGNFKECTEINNGTLTLSSYTGNVIRWESSIDAGYTWTEYNDSTSNTFTYTNLPQFTQFRAVVGNGSCGNVYSDTARIVVIPAFTPEITVEGGDVCSGEPITLTATAFILPDTVGIIAGGHFNQANPAGWLIYEDGVLMDPFPADHDNEVPGPWAETNSNENNPITFCGQGWLNEKEGKKFALVAGAGVNSWMETPAFNLVGMPAAELSFVHAYMLGPNATARITLSLNGGPFNIVLAEYAGDLMNGMPNVVNDVGIDLSPYLGMTNLRIRFEYDSPDGECSVWAVDDISIPTPAPDIEYEWGPVSEIPGGSGQTVVVVPPTTTEYTLTVYVAGCPGSATKQLITVVDNPEVTTTNTCVGDTVSFIAVTGYDGTWSVSGGGDINNDGLFSADSAGCFEAYYTTTSGACSGSASFMVFPQAPIPDVDSGCGPITVTPPPTVEGFDIEYSFYDGADGTWGPNVPPTEENCDGYRIRTRYITNTLCDSIPIGTVSDCSVSPVFIRVLDLTPPSFTVPADTTITLIDSCGYDPDPIKTGYPTDEWDDCPTPLEASYIDVVDSGACEVLVTRYWTLTDDCGNDSTQIQTIWIIDGTKPIINPVAQNSSIQCSTTDPDLEPEYVAWLADYAGARASDPCSEVLEWTADTALTEWIGVGGNAQRTVTFYVTDECGNVDSTTAVFTITDDEPPVIYCPSSVETTIAADSCSSDTFAIGIVTATDECSVPLLVWEMTGATTGSDTGQVIGQRFNVGITTVHYTAIDNAGLTDTCSFTVWVKHLNPPTDNIICPPYTVRADAAAYPDCDVYLDLDTVAYTDPCNEIDSIWNDSPHGYSWNDADGDYPIGITEFNWYVLDVSDNVDTCHVVVIVSDTTKPEFDYCPDPVIDSLYNGGCDKISDQVTDPTWYEDCSPLALYYELTLPNDSIVQDSGFATNYSWPIGQTDVHYILVDTFGNEAYCDFYVLIKDTLEEGSDYQCPDTTLIEAYVTQSDCEPYISLNTLNVIDTCDAIDTFWHTSSYGTPQDPSDNYPVGHHSFRWVVRNYAGDIDSTCEVNIVVYDTIAPYFESCPDPAIDSLTNNDCDKVLNLEDPVPGDDCSPLTMTYELYLPNHNDTISGTGSASGYPFPPGQTDVHYILRDTAGNEAYCDFYVLIKTTLEEGYAYTCPDGSETTADRDSCGDWVTLLPPVVTDTCDAIDSIWHDSEIYIDSMNPSGFYDIGVTDFNWYIRERDGDTITCPVEVIVHDYPMELECPGDTIIPADWNDTVATNVYLLPPTFHDNCPDSILTWRTWGATTITGGDTLSSGEMINILNGPNTYNQDTTWVEYTFVDRFGDSLVCDFRVIVTTAPIIECPPSDTFYANESCEYPLDPGIPELIQGAPPIDWYYTITHDGDTIASGSDLDNTDPPLPDSIGIIDFPLGVSTIEWIAQNESGADTCWHFIEVLDTTPPAIYELDSLEDCMEVIQYAIYNSAEQDLYYPDRPDYIVFNRGDSTLNLTKVDEYIDNCELSCPDSITWVIDLSPYTYQDGTNVPAQDSAYWGYGQLSEWNIFNSGGSYTESELQFPGDGTYMGDVVHWISYYATDCAGNTSLVGRRKIIVTPRPKIEKLNFY